MSRIQQLFQNKKKRGEPVLSIFFTAGYPRPDTTARIGLALSTAGVDMLEVGFPFSDSLVDGPTIQLANEQALADGMDFLTYFSEIKALRSQSSVAIVAMCCLNPILQYGVERFADACVLAGIDGVLIADLPPEELEHSYRQIFIERGLDIVLLITSHCPVERIKYIDSLCTGFLYVVSSDAITGSELLIDTERRSYFERLRAMDLKNPLVVGFGISDKDRFDAACSVADGAIIGSAFVRALAGSDSVEEISKQFVAGIVGEVS